MVAYVDVLIKNERQRGDGDKIKLDDSGLERRQVL